MRALVFALVLAIAAPAVADAGDADSLERSGRQRLGAGVALVAFGVIGWGVSTAGTVLSIVRYVEDARGQCGNGACDRMAATATGLSIGGGIAEAGGLAGGIPLIISGVRRKRAARRLRAGVGVMPSGAALQVGGRF